MRKRISKITLFLSLLFVMVFASCTSYKQVPYLQNSAGLDTLAIQSVVYEPTIQPHDLLNISVYSSQDEQTARVYNLVVQSEKTSGNSLTSQQVLQTYIVDSEGCVIVPNIGKVCLGGLTIHEAENFILDKINGAFAVPPTVVVRWVDYKISVLGEVASPGMYSSKDGRINLFQALANAGDLTVHGKRDNVKIIREELDGTKKVYEVNLNDAALLNSPLYYLQQNDVVYVTPNKRKAKSSDIGSATSLWFSGTSIALSVATLLINLIH